MRDKIELRAELAARRAVAFSACPNAGELLVAHFPVSIDISNLSVVTGYLPFRSEVDPRPLMRQLAQNGAQLAIPRMNSPFPLWGGVGVGGTAADTCTEFVTETAPHPQSLILAPSPQGGRGEALRFHLCDFDNIDHFQTNKYGILEPVQTLPIATPTILLVPLLGFDRQGNRIGYGKGYYDQAISALGKEVTTIGLGFAEQEVPIIPTQPHDQRLDWIITQNEAYRVPS